MRILFYGNCQLGALAKHIRHNSDEYQILSCEDYGLEKFWADEGLFAVWSPENKDRSDQYKSRVIEAVQTCDVFVFQHIENSLEEAELRTENIIKYTSSKCLTICFPSFRYWGYLYKVSEVNYFLNQLYAENKNPKEILFLLKNETRENIINEIKFQHEKSIKESRDREEKHSKMYDNCITVSDFMENYYDKKLIAYDHSHPSVHVYNYYLDKLREYGIIIHQNFDNKSILPGSIQLFVKDLFYFTDYFNSIEDLDYHSIFFRKKLNIKLIENQIDMIKQF